MAYLDHAAAARPSELQMKAIIEDMQKLTLSNPHSRHPSSRHTSDIVERARSRVLQYFNTTSDKYAVIFTSGATDSLRIVADCFDFGVKLPSRCEMHRTLSNAPDGIFAYMEDSHTSVIGMREIVRNRCNAVCVVDFDEIQELSSNYSKPKVSNGIGQKSEQNAKRGDDPSVGNNLFAITAMSNFCGRKYPLDFINRIQSWKYGKNYVCLDAASWVSTSFLDLSKFSPDFVAISFYKIFGFPTGIGALIVRHQSSHLLQKRYFGGGTVQLSVPDDFVVHRKNGLAEMFEDGTINYWGIATLEHGFRSIELFGGIEEIQRKTYELAKKAYQSLTERKHKNGYPIAKVYHNGETYQNTDLQGPIVTFNLLRDDHSYIGYSEVEKMCDLFGVELRTGCFCNQGACQRYLRLSKNDLLTNYQNGKVCGDSLDLIDGRPVGAIRISFGRQSTIKDVELFWKMLDSCFVSSSPFLRSLISVDEENTKATLVDIFAYPIKSCAPVVAQKWRISATGLEFDRYWMIASDDGVALSQKRKPQLCLIQPKVEDESLCLSSKVGNNKEIRVPLLPVGNLQCDEQRVCSDRVKTIDCGDEAASWVSEELSQSGCRLRRFAETTFSRTCSTSGNSGASMSLPNEAPYLMINRRSAAHLASLVGLQTENIVRRFRPNFVIDGLPPFFEDRIVRLRIGHLRFKVVGKCTRCQVICIDQNTGEKDPKVLLALREQRLGSKVKGLSTLIKLTKISHFCKTNVELNADTVCCKLNAVNWIALHKRH